jgi:hypothetical protein
LPFSVVSGQTVTVSNANGVIFGSNILSFDATAINNSFLISNLLTYVSEQPITININLTYQSILYFYGIQTITANIIRNFSHLAITQSNKQVYSIFAANMILSDLSAGDKLILTANYNYFYPSNQTDCTKDIAICSLNSIIIIILPNNYDSTNSLTSLTVNLVNIGYIGNYAINLTVYDNSQTYRKQSSIYTLSTTIPNIINIEMTQNNPYLN